MTEETNPTLYASEILKRLTSALEELTATLKESKANKTAALALIHARMSLALVEHTDWTLQIDDGIVDERDEGLDIVAVIAVDPETQSVEVTVPTEAQRANVEISRRWQQGVNVILAASGALTRVDLKGLERLGLEALEKAHEIDMDPKQVALIRVDLEAVRASIAYVDHLDSIARKWSERLAAMGVEL